MEKNIDPQNPKRTKGTGFLTVISVILLIAFVLMLIQTVFCFCLVIRMKDNEALLDSVLEEADTLRQPIADQADSMYQTIKNFDPAEAAKSNDTAAVDEIRALRDNIPQFEADGNKLSRCLQKAEMISNDGHYYAIRQLKNDPEIDETEKRYFKMDTIAFVYSELIDSAVNSYEYEMEHLTDDYSNSAYNNVVRGATNDAENLHYSAMGGIKEGEYFLTVGDKKEFHSALSDEIGQYTAKCIIFLSATAVILIVLVICVVLLIKRKKYNKKIIQNV